MKNLTRSLIVLVILISSGCSKKETSEIKPFPPKPEGALFYNSSSITDVRRMANMSIKRAADLTNIEFAMVFLDHLPEAYSIETYSADLVHEWRIGEKNEGKGVLFCFVEDLQEMKIEVTYELEPNFTDAFCKSFQETIKTYFSSKHFGDVVTNSINNMVKHYQGDTMDEIDFVPLGGANLIKADQFISGGGGIVERDYVFDKEAKLAAIKNVDPKVLARFSAGESVHDAISNYLDSLEAGISHPDLGVTTPGTRYMRIEYPKTPAFLQRKYRDYIEAMPYQVLQQGDLAAARFTDNAAVALLLVKGPDGLWRVDLPKTWGIAQGSKNFATFFINPSLLNQPWQFAFPDQHPRMGRFTVEFNTPIGEDPAKTIEALIKRIDQEPSNAKLRLDLAKVLFWDCYLILAAIEESEKSIALDPDYSEAYWFAINARYRAPALEGIQNHYQSLMRLHPNDSSIEKNYKWFIKNTE